MRQVRFIMFVAFEKALKFRRGDLVRDLGEQLHKEGGFMGIVVELRPKTRKNEEVSAESENII